tara:strand:+ start:401 stop:1087 length:687 start_codon:yes stop_codon:yes gene_type:complete
MKKIFIAVDTSNIKEARKIVRLSKHKKLNLMFKFGLEFFYSKKGRNFISKLKTSKIFLDLKINDIPNTSLAALGSIKDLKNVNYITVHINSGYETIKAVKQFANKKFKKLKIFGVSVLTSLNEKSLKQIGHTRSIKEIVKKQAKLAKLSKLDGIICSGQEVSYIKKICKKMEIITPGIRFKGDKSQDQKRVLTPSQAFKNGATGIVIGRSVTKGNIKKNIQKLINSLN